MCCCVMSNGVGGVLEFDLLGWVADGEDASDGVVVAGG